MITGYRGKTDECDMENTGQADNAIAEKLVPVTVRFSQAAYDAISELAEEYGVSIAIVVRLAVDGNLDKYLGTLRYVDKADSRRIMAGIAAAANIMQDVGNQLRRIGVNYNQLAKLENMKAKKAEMESAWKKRSHKYDEMVKYKRDLDAVNAAIDAAQKAQQNGDELSREQLEGLVSRYEKATKELGEALWHIRG